MADYDVKLVVTADTEDAKEKLTDLSATRVEPVKVETKVEPPKIDPPQAEPVKVPVEADEVTVEPVELKAKAVVGEVAMPNVEPVEIPVTTQEPTIKPPKPPKVKVPVEADTDKAEAGLKTFVGRMRDLLTGFGLVGLGTMIGGAVSRIVDSFKSAERAAERFREVQSSLANAKAIQGLADEYVALKDAADAAAAAQSRELDMIDREVAARRKLAEAKAEAAKNAEIAAVDTAAPDYDRRVAEIERRYRSERAARSAANAEADVVLSRQRLGSEAAAKRREADAESAHLRELDAKIAQLRRDRSKNEIESVSLNDADKTTAVGAVGTTLKQLFTGDWGRMADAKTEEGDAKREVAAKKAAADELEIARLVAERKRIAENQKRLAEEAESLIRQADAKAPEIEAAKLQGEAAAQADRNADSKAAADARAASETFERRLDEIRARAADAAELGAAETDRERAAVYGRRERRETAAFDAAKAKVEAETAKPIGERDETMIARWREDMARSLAEALGARQSRTDIERSAAREREGRMFEAGPDRQNRLTAMGLGSGVSGAPTIDRHFERVIDLLRANVAATRDNKPTAESRAAVYGE